MPGISAIRSEFHILFAERRIGFVPIIYFILLNQNSIECHFFIILETSIQFCFDRISYTCYRHRDDSGQIIMLIICPALENYIRLKRANTRVINDCIKALSFSGINIGFLDQHLSPFRAVAHKVNFKTIFRLFSHNCIDRKMISIERERRAAACRNNVNRTVLIHTNRFVCFGIRHVVAVHRNGHRNQWLKFFPCVWVDKSNIHAGYSVALPGQGLQTVRSQDFPAYHNILRQCSTRHVHSELHKTGINRFRTECRISIKIVGSQHHVTCNYSAFCHFGTTGILPVHECIGIPFRTHRQCPYGFPDRNLYGRRNC